MGGPSALWLIKEEEWYTGVLFRIAEKFHEQMEEQYQQGVGLQFGQLSYGRSDGSILVHYSSHDLRSLSWIQTRY